LKTKFLFLILLSTLLFWFSSCVEKQVYPDIPSLEFKTFIKMTHPAGYDSVGIIVLTYTDGDGDLGLDKKDTTSYNFFVTYYKMNNGVLSPGTIFNPVTQTYDTIFFNNRFYDLAPPDYIGWIKGEIEDTIRPLYDPRSSKSRDTIMFQIYMTDRAGNKSNIVETPIIVVQNP